MTFSNVYDRAFSGERLQKTARYSDDYQQLTKELSKKEKLIQDLIKDNKIFFDSAQENAEILEEKLYKISLLEKELQTTESINSLWLNVNHVCPKIEIFCSMNDILKDQNSRLIGILSEL